ncbi:MAG: AtpZ/AtpI family protein [Blautia sp.]|nr:AtpZ/AtpI family protein [Blautia sp.]
MKKWNDMIKSITLFSQFGFSFITPMIMCVGIGWLFTAKLSVGAWVFIPGFIFGIGSSFMVAYKFYRKAVRDNEREQNERKKTISFNQHE